MVTVVRWVEAGLAVCGFVALCWVAAGAAERAADWWRGRRRGERPRGISEDCWYGAHEDCDGCACNGCGHADEDELRAEADEEMAYFDGPLPLPPERTWEQMTSHQLLIVDGTRGLDSAGIVREHEPWRVEAHLAAERERRAPWWEAEHRAAYESLGFEYPSGLMARVRELTP